MRTFPGTRGPKSLGLLIMLKPSAMQRCVAPWYEPCLEMTFQRPRSPMLYWYFLAILMAVSTASDPPDTKYTLLSGSGVRLATLAASLMADGATVPPGE